MRRVDSEGDSRGSRGRRRGGAQASSKLRRATLEWLERRELLSTSTSNLPSPVVVTPPDLDDAVSTFDQDTLTASATSPSVAVDPLNSQDMIAAWTYHDAKNLLNVGATNGVDAYVVGAYSVDGGVSWQPLPGIPGTDLVTSDVQINFSVGQSGGPVVFAETTDAHVAFDRNNTAYLLTSTHDDAGASGVLDLQSFSFSMNAVDGGPVTAMDPPAQTLTNSQVYAWDAADGGGADSAQTPVLGVDDNVPTFSDVNATGQTVTQTDPFTGNVYVAWASTDTNTSPGIGGFNPNSIKMVSSSDGGNTFTPAAYVDDPSNANVDGSHSSTARYSEPAIAISQGSAAVPGGQVTIVYDDDGTFAKAAPTPFDQILAQTDLEGGAAQAFAGPIDTPINIAQKNPVSGLPDIAATTDIPIDVSITDPAFTTLQALDVNLSIAYPNMGELSAVLFPPAESGLAPVELFANGVNGLGTATGDGIAGANLGITTSGEALGTTFDQAAIRSIRNAAAKSPYVGTYKPEDENALLSLQGATAAQLDGTWILEITSFKNETSFTSGPTVLDESLDFSSGNNPGFNPTTGLPSPQVTVVDDFSALESLSPNINPGVAVTPASYTVSDPASLTTGVRGTGNVTSPVSPVPILPQPSIASNNTLGAYSPYEGWLYVAYTGSYGAPASGQSSSTDIFLIASDDGGQTWTAINPAGAFGTSTGIQINDADASTDGFSGTIQGPTDYNNSTDFAVGRTTFEPQVAVDQYTGSVVVSYLDARNDASNARVATYVAVSNDGGVDFAPDTYANPTNTAVDAITGKTVGLGPIPDNQSAGNANRDSFGFGQYQALAVADGTIIPFWASNQNTGTPAIFVGSEIVDSIMTDAGGPRVISSTMGPVGLPGDPVNTARAADGSAVANTIMVTFDRPIDPATFNPDGPASSGQPIGTGDVRVYYQDPYGPTITGVSTSHATVSRGTYTSLSPVVSGLGGEPIVDGQLTLSLSGFTNLGAVTVRLVAPNGQSFLVPTANGTSSLSGTYALPANVVGGAVDGVYQLMITDTLGQVGMLKSWSIQLNGLSVGLRVLTIAPVPNLSDPLDDGTYGYTTFKVTFDPTNPSNGVATGVGTYSYVIRPTVSDRIRYVGAGGVMTSAPVVEDAQLPQLPVPGLPLTGTTATSSSLYLVGHPGQTILSGTLSLSLTDSNVQDLTITLTAPGGQTFVLPTSTGTALNQTYTLPAGFLGTAVDGRYQLTIVARVGSDAGRLTAWSLDLTPTGPNGNAMDQNADGSPGQDPETTPFTGLTPGDDYAVPMPDPTSPVTYSGPGLPPGPYSNGSLPLIVSGPSIVQTNVTGNAGTTTGTTANNLVANDDVGSVGVTFGQDVQISSVDSSQVLSLIGPAGPILTPQTFASTGISKTFTPPTTQVGVTIPRGAGTSLVSTLTISNTGLTVSSLTVTLTITDPQDSSLTLELIAPNGTVIPLAVNAGGNGANFSDTTFSDTPPPNGLTIPIASGTAPFGLTYQPATALTPALQGMALDGQWKLMIQDNLPTTSTLALGFLNSWSLAVTPQVPQGTGTSLTSSLTVANPDDSFTIGHLGVQLNITAPNDSNIEVYLTAPNGDKVLLINNLPDNVVGGGANANFTNTSFDDSATVNIVNGVAPYTQTYVPISPQPTGFVTLSSLDGLALDGVWHLTVEDLSVAGTESHATLNSWSLVATPQIKVTASETYNSTDTSATTFVSTDTSTQVYSSPDVSYTDPAPIPATVGATVTSQITFPSTGGTFNIANLAIALSIAYPRDTNLSVELISPAGVTVPLFAGVGGLGVNFGVLPPNPLLPPPPLTYTVLSDSGTIGIANGTAPFISGQLIDYPANLGQVYRPESPLSVLDGSAIDGTWTLRVTNNSGLEAGTFNGWAMIVTPEAAPAAGGLPAGATQPIEPIPIVPAAGTSGPLTSSITFPATDGTYTIAGLLTTLTLTAPAGGSLADLTGVLVAPDGISATLFAAGDGTFTGTGTATRTFTPLNPISGQSQFADIALDGLWQLEITDSNTGRSMDALNGWSLTTTPSKLALAQPDEPVPVTTAPAPGTSTPPTSLKSSIAIPDSVPIKDLRLRLTLSAPQDANISATLTGPNGVTIALFTGANLGATGSGSGFSNVIFDSNAATSIDAGTAPYSATFRPEGSLATFNGITAAGTWTLTITDSSPNSTGPVAVLDGWSLINTPPPSATLANTYEISFPTQQLSGTYSLTVGAGILGADPSVNNPLAPSNPALGTPANPNLNAGVDVLRGTSTTGVVATTPITYNAASVPVAIPAPPSLTATSTLVSQIVVPDSFLIQGVTSAGLPGLVVTLNITFPNDPDLVAVLISPDGTMIHLFTNVGNGGTKANFTGTILEDTVNPPAPIDSAGAPFFGTYNPETPLSTLAGQNANGTWSLEITNALRPGESTLYSGTLNSWSLTFQKPLPSSGLGDPVADRQTVNFQVFNIAPTNPLTNDTWTAVGPAGVTVTAGQTGTFAGSVASVAVDPSDPTGNTVYVASSSGGIWKTTDFLTTSPAGPTYLPLTDFGPTFSLNVGGIAVFGRNNDPDQSVLFAGTGFAEATYPYNGAGETYPNLGGNAGSGVGILRSFDGGATWTLLDSLANTYSNGTPIPEALRDHTFVGDTTYQVVVDPTPEPDGDIIIYAALGGPTGGLYQSVDSGDTWKLLSTTYTLPSGTVESFNNAPCTSIVLDPNSKSPTTGNDDILYAAFQGIGVMISTNQGQSFTLMTGQLGIDPLLVGPQFPAAPVAVSNDADSPNGANGRIVLAKPALTGNAAEDLLYQDWLYAAVENTNGTFNGLYVTKDRGENWTKVDLGTLPTPAVFSTTFAVPTNNQQAASYDPTANPSTGATDHYQNGNYALTMTIDPTNPNIVYLGGSTNFQDTGLIRVDLTDLYDAENFTSFSDSRNDGGTLTQESTGAISVLNPLTAFVDGAIYNPPDNPNIPATPYLNLRHAPNTGVPGSSPFNVNATLVVSGVAAAGFTNDGSGVTWTYLDEPLKANAGDSTGSTNLHDSVAYIDPVTGNVRLIFADDQGVFTALLNPDGTMDDGIGTDVSANYSRNGNLQDEQFFYGAAQPSNVAAQAAGALFYASGQTLLAAQSDPNILNNGDLTWSDVGVLDPVNGEASRQTIANDAIGSSDRSGVGIAVDETGGATTSGPTGTGPSVYEYDVPLLGGNTTDFFRVNGIGQTTGLVNDVNAEFPQGNYRASGTSGDDLAGAIANGQIPLGNFAVNPLNGSQILIGSATGRLYETTNKGVQWLPIGQPTQFDGTQLSAIVYGAPDPGAPSGVGNLNNFIYVGTVGGLNTTPENTANGGKIFVTQSGGQGWINISSGLDGSSVVAIYTDPNRGSHEAYAVTLNGVFFSADTVGLAAAGKTVWTNITNNLTQIQHSPYGQAILGQSVFAGFQSNSGTANQGTAQYGGFTSIVADYRYAVPDPTGATDLSGNVLTYPVLYVSGYGGVFRSLDNGASWTIFPNTAFDAAPVDGGYLPSVDVTDLQLDLGNVNPATGHATQTAGDAEVLMATTGGRGVFAIGLAPDVFPLYTKLDPTTDSGLANGIPDVTNDPTPIIDGLSEISNFGNLVTITLTDASNGKILGTGTTNSLGQFSIQIIQYPPTSPNYDPTFFESSTAVDDKVVGIQATDSSGAKGNVSTFAYTLDTTPPATPSKVALESAYDTGRSSSDDNTNLSVPAQTAPGSPLTLVAPIYDVTTTIPPSNPLTPNPIGLTIELIRSTSPNFPVGPNTLVVATAPGGVSSPTRLSDNNPVTGLAALAGVAGGIDQTFYYEAEQVDAAGNVSGTSPVLAVYVDTIAPVTPPKPTLTSIIDNTQPLFTVPGTVPTAGTPVVSDQLYLYRSISTVDGGAPVLAGIGNVGASTVYDGENIPAPAPPPNVDGVYTYNVAWQDVFGNFSALSPGITVTINTQTPPSTPYLDPIPPLTVGGVSYYYDSGRSQSDDITNLAIPLPTPGATPNFTAPVFDVPTTKVGTGQPATVTVELLRSTSPTGTFTVVGTTPAGTSPELVTDTSIVALADVAGGINQTFYYEAEQVDAAGITSNPSGILAVHVDTIVPKTLLAPTLDATSNTGLVPSQDITNKIHPLFDLGAGDMLGSVTVNGTTYEDQLLLYRSFDGAPSILVGTAAVGATQVRDATGAIPDGVYLYSLDQEDVAGNVSAYSNSIAVTVNTSTPAAPTLALLPADDSGLPLHPDVTNVKSPRIYGTSPFNSPTNFPVSILVIPPGGSDASGIVVGTTYPAANGTYQVQIATAGTAYPNGLPDGTYTLVARATNLAGTPSYSAPLTVTIKANGPQITPSLVLVPADDTGIKGDGVTADHNPSFTGITDPGDTVTLYALVNGVITSTNVTATSSTINGSFTLALPYSLTDGSTTLYAQTTDIAGNTGLLSAPLNVKIITVAGDYLGTGTAQLAIFRPNSETYFVQGAGAVPADTTPGRDVPVQYDYNGDGQTDYAAYQFDTATYVGKVSPGSTIDTQYGQGGVSLPVSGYYDGATGTFIYANYSASTGVWEINLPRPGGFSVQFGIPHVDIPVPAAYDGGYTSEIAIFRPTVEAGGDADMFIVYSATGQYFVSFTSPAVEALGFTYQPGDIPAPGDYDGVGRDEFAIYRPSTGQFFILDTPNRVETSTWTLRVVQMNLPGGPNANDVPVSEDYDGNGHVDPAVYRPSTSTFYILHSSTGIQQAVQYGVGGLDIAAAGPLLYRLTALQGAYASTGGYIGSSGGGGGNGFTVNAFSVHASAPSSSSSSTVPVPTTIALAAPVSLASTTAPTGLVNSSAPVSTSTPALPVTVGASTPKTLVKAATPSKSHGVAKKSHHAKVETPKKSTKPLAVDTKGHHVEAKAPAVESHPKAEHPKVTSTTAKKPMESLAALAALKNLVLARKGKSKG